MADNESLLEEIINSVSKLDGGSFSENGGRRKEREYSDDDGGVTDRWYGYSVNLGNFMINLYKEEEIYYFHDPTAFTTCSELDGTQKIYKNGDTRIRYSMNINQDGKSLESFNGGGVSDLYENVAKKVEEHKKLQKQNSRTKIISGIAAGIAASTLATMVYTNRPLFTQSYFPRNFEATQVEANGYLQESYNRILITGTKEFIAREKEALDLIRNYDPYNWEIVQRNITRITLTSHSGIDVVIGRYTSNDNQSKSEAWIASEIVHEAWHRENYRNWKTFSGREGERKSIEKQNDFFRRVGYPPINIEDMLRTEYWKIDYEKRTW